MGARNVVTGAFGYTGRHIAKRLLEAGEEVATLTSRTLAESPFRDQVKPIPFRFDDRAELARSLEGVEVLYNTYWIRFERDGRTFREAVENTKTLIGAAKDAGVRRFVHVSITKPSHASPHPYFSGKAEMEDALRESGLSYAIVRPTVMFGGSDVLVNNMAWMLRRMPVFGILGSGDYRIQPVHVEDVARLCIESGARTDDVTLDAVGPEVLTMEELLRAIGRAVGARTLFVRVPPAYGLLITDLLGRFVVRDVVLTRHEVGALLAGLLYSDDPPTGRIALTEWMAEHRDSLGRVYASELMRHF